MVEGGFAAMLYVTLTIPGTSRKILSKEPRPQGGALKPKFLNPKPRSRNKFGMTKRAETNSHVMLNLFQHLVYFFSTFSRRTFHPRPQDGVFRCGLNKVGLFHLFKWLLGLILETKTEKIAEMLAINNGNITHFGKARAIL
jgi:hypothetical protein